jgi:hypothetical protein
MSLANIAEAAAVRLFYRLALYVVFGLFGAIFALFALYNLTIAGMTALEVEFGAVTARLTVAGIYMVLATASAGMLWFLARKAGKFEPAPEPAPRHVQLAALIEALMLGYEAAKKGRRTR